MVNLNNIIGIIIRNFNRILRKLQLSAIHKIHKLRNKNKYKYNIVNILKRYRSMNGTLFHSFQEYKLYELNEILHKENPKSILEFGSGTTTCIFAYYVKKTGANLTSVDESRKWLEHTKKIVTEIIGERAVNIQYIYAKKIWDGLTNPKRAFYDYNFNSKYDLIYIDGPSLRINNVRDKKVINSNIVEMIRKGYTPKIIVVDGRYATTRYIAKHFSNLYKLNLSDLFNNDVKIGYRYHSIFTLGKES